MPQKADKSKRRRLRAPALTVRERAAREAARSSKPGLRQLLSRAGMMITGSPVWKALRFIGRLPVWKAFKLFGRIILPPYIRNSWRELRQVTWTNGRQTRQLTTAVVVFSIIFGIIVAVFDYGLDQLFKEVIK